VSAYCPRSSLPATVLGWLAARPAHLRPGRPPGRGGTRPLALEVRLDAVAAVLLDGLSYRRAGRMVGISKTEVGDSLDLLLGPQADLGFCQPDGTFITSLDDLGQWLAEMATSGEAVVVDGGVPAGRCGHRLHPHQPGAGDTAATLSQGRAPCAPAATRLRLSSESVPNDHCYRMRVQASWFSLSMSGTRSIADTLIEFHK
jgi:hypothetical protein